MLFIVGPGSETWEDVKCTKPSISSNFLISIEECNILRDNTVCVTKLRDEGHIPVQNVCIPVHDVYTCRVSQEYAPRTCCLSYTLGSQVPTYNSCSIGKYVHMRYMHCVTLLKYICGFFVPVQQLQQ